MKQEVSTKNKGKKIIALVGLMGVGKTTLGMKLAKKMGYYFIDCDQEIEDREGKTISEIFAENGEPYFRQLEKNMIKEITARDEEIILSLGGGAFMDEDSRKILKEKTITIWLYATIDAILQRVGAKGNRPLLQTKNRREVLKELSKKRYPIYAKADCKFDTSNENHENLLPQIVKTINQIKNAK